MNDLYTPPKGSSLLAKLCVVFTILLILVGAEVTTSGAGMAAPNAPHVEGVLIHPNVPGTDTPWYKDPALFREHGHRLVAMVVSACVGALAAMLWQNWPAFLISFGWMIAANGLRALKIDSGLVTHIAIWPAMLLFIVLILSKAKRSSQRAVDVQWMAFIAFIAVFLQALMGTLRVELETAKLYSVATSIRVFHGVFAHMFLALLAVIAVRLSPSIRLLALEPSARRFANSAFSLLILYFIQLACAAYLRHKGLGLAIPTWPAANPATGSWLPAAWSHDIGIHFLHSRILPFLILGHVIGMTIGIAKRAKGEPLLRRPGFTIAGLVVVQIILGVLIIWSPELFNKRSPHIINTHVVVGALICVTTATLYARAKWGQKAVA